MIDLIFLLLIYICIYSLLSMGLNMITGYTGLLSLCQAAFFGIGAYATAILTVYAGWGFWTALIMSCLITSAFGFLIGLPVLRLKGDYLAIATLGFGEIVRNVILNWDSFTRGSKGINGIPFPVIFGIEIKSSNLYLFFAFVFIFVVIFYFILNRIVHSRFGRALEAIREDEIAASSMGINVTKYKLISFCIGAFLGGVAGSLWAVFFTSIAPDTFNLMLSIQILCMIVLGGLGNNLAAIVGAFIVVTAAELPKLLGFSSIIPPELNQILFGLILVLAMLYRTQGIMGKKRFIAEGNPNKERAVER